VANSLGIGIIGTGFGAKVHVPGFAALADSQNLEVLALLGRSTERTAELAQQAGIPHACTNLSEFLAVPGLSAVSIASPPYLHYQQALAVLRAGKHLLLEKPVTLEVAQAQDLLKQATRRNLVHCVDFEFRTIPHWQYLNELLIEGAVGPLYMVTVDWLVEGRADPRRAWSWYAEASKGGGVLGALGSHVFDYLGWLLGPITRLNARLDTLIHSRPDPETSEWLTVDSDDSAQLWLELADGTPVNVRLCTAAWQGSGHRLAIYGEQGSLHLCNENQKDYIHGFKLFGGKPGEVLREIAVPERLQFDRTHPDGRQAPFIEIARRFVEGIREGESIAPSLREGIYSQLLMDLAHESHRTQQWLDVPSTEFPDMDDDED
jgi:predicted dehydrogenase